MSWFDKWIEKKYRKIIEHRESEGIVKMSTAQAIPRGLAIGPSSELNGHRSINFTVHKATGGFVIETRLYDERKDRNQNSLYVITSDKDLGEEISKIITLEALKS